MSPSEMSATPAKEILEPSNTEGKSATVTIGHVDPYQIMTPISRPPTRFTFASSRATTLTVTDTINGVKSEDDCREYIALAGQFTALVTTSTFTSALIIAFLSLANDIIHAAADNPYEIGLLFSLLGTGFHLSVALIAGRAATLCYQRAKCLLSDSDPDLGICSFRRYIVVCEELQLVGTMLFIPAILLDGFFMFDNKVYPGILFGGVALAAWRFYTTGFWKFGVLLRYAKGFGSFVASSYTSLPTFKCWRKKNATSAPPEAGTGSMV